MTDEETTIPVETGAAAPPAPDLAPDVAEQATGIETHPAEPEDLPAEVAAVGTDDDVSADEAEQAVAAWDEALAEGAPSDSDDVGAEAGLASIAQSEELRSDEVLTEEGDADADADADAEPEEPAPAPVESPYDRPGKWFVLHTQSGYENKVRQNLEARRASMNMEGKIHEIVIPMEDVVEFKGGKKVVVQKKMFPGYLLVRCRLDDDSWYVVRNTPGVTGFVGAGNKPSPLPRKDVETFLAVKTPEEQEAAPKRTRPRLQYEINETVRVKEGPFADFSGEVVEINEDQLKVKVLVNIFGRETPVELEFAQVAKL